MKKILISIALIGTVSLAIVGATRAYFREQAVLGTNTITAGNVDIEFVNDQLDPITLPLWTSADDKVFPGWNTDKLIGKVVSVKNFGTLNINYNASIEDKTDSHTNDTDLRDALRFDVKQGSVVVKTGLTFAELVALVSQYGNRPLNAGASETLVTIIPYFPYEAYEQGGQSGEVKFDIKVIATQQH